MATVIDFHNLAHIFISLIGAVLLLAIYYNIRRRFQQVLEEDDAQKRVDRGLLYLSLALFVWVLAGSWSLFQDQLGFGYQIGVSLFSILNNMFILMALFYFHNAPGFIYKNEKNVRLIILIIIVVTVLTLLLSYWSNTNPTNNIALYAIPDLILSGFLSYLLMISCYRTFLHRGLKLVAAISILVIILMFISQLPQVFTQVGNDFINSLIKLISKTSLISLFLVLATSWVIQLANTPKVTEMQIKFLDWSLIQLSIPSKQFHKVNIDFGSKTTQYKNLLKFAIRRKYGTGDEQCILVGASGEIKNQTYLSRIIENINDIHPQETASQLDRKDLFTFLGLGKYRLRMLPEHIEIESTLLKEFTKSAENQVYTAICN